MVDLGPVEAFWEIGLTSKYAVCILSETPADYTPRDYDMHGPAGPTAFWKVTDHLAEEKTSSTPLAYF